LESGGTLGAVDKTRDGPEGTRLALVADRLTWKQRERKNIFATPLKREVYIYSTGTERHI
jgi:hypothetical protein